MYEYRAFRKYTIIAGYTVHPINKDHIQTYIYSNYAINKMLFKYYCYFAFASFMFYSAINECIMLVSSCTFYMFLVIHVSLFVVPHFTCVLMNLVRVCVRRGGGVES